MRVRPSVTITVGSAPVLPDGGFSAVRTAGSRALRCRVAIETMHEASSIACHRPSNFCEIEPSQAAQPLHWDLLLAIGPLEGPRSHAELRRLFLRRERLLVHAQYFRMVRLSTALTMPA